MGTPKMLLRWGGTTVLAHILRTLRQAAVEERIVVVGCDREAVEDICSAEGAIAVFNPTFDSGEMLSSLQVGLLSMPPACEAALVVLGDQPSLQAAVVRAVLQSSEVLTAEIVVPSYRHKRGHPWMVGSAWWPEIARMRPPDTPREFLHRHGSAIRHVEVHTDTILRDIDTPDEYLRSAPS
jgi:CTP:molybdopterin cytidylyltransferase MocA